MTARDAKIQYGRAMLGDPALGIWALYLALFPVYIFPSGLPQPADILVVLLVPLVLATWNGRLASRSVRPLRWLLAFVAYVVVSALVWSTLQGSFSLSLEDGFLLSPFFYMFNATVFVLALLLHRRHGEVFFSITVRVVLFTAIAQVPLDVIIGRTTGLRSSVLFNASNQLGYYAVLAGSIIVFGQRRANLSTVLVTIGLMACGYLAVISASKAALSGIAMLAIVTGLQRIRTVLLASVAAAILVFAVNPVSEAVERAQLRIESDQSYGFFEERGYDRIAAYPHYLLLGSGEGAYNRFENTGVIGDHELHSSAGTMIFCYGFVGTILFCGFLLQVLTLGRLRQVLLILPAAVYGMTHQGLRVSMLWVLLAMFVLVGERVVRRTRLPAATRTPAVSGVST